MNHLPRLKVRQRMNAQPPDRVDCDGHRRWVLKKFQCALMGKHSNITGLPHECQGRLDPHHATTKGAGGGDNDICPLCRWTHDRLDSPGHSQKSVEAEFGVDMKATGAALWRLDIYHRGKFEREWREQWGETPLPY